MRERVCKNCGGREYRVVGQNMVKCAFCGTLYVDEHASKEEEVLLVGAYEILRAMRFADAIAEFDKVLALFPLSFEGHFGKALAKHQVILYTNRKGTSRRPRFLGDKISSISDDEDFKRAVELAPSETATTYQNIAKRIDRIKKKYEDVTSKQNYDVILCAVGHEDDAPVETIVKTYESLKKSGKSVYLIKGYPNKENEEDTFRALETCKALLLFAIKKTVFAELKHLTDRYQYLISQREKASSSFIIAYDENVFSKKQLPRDVAFCKNVVDMNSISFLQDVNVLINNEIENFVGKTAKIETIKVERVKPKKKKYVDIESVTPSELGHYQVENVNLSDQTKIKWIFLSLKNGDFETAKELINTELEKDPYNSELFFAQLMAEKEIKTQEEFFSNISNFADKEKIDNILRYATREFAQYFVDSWETLIMKLGEVDYFSSFLVYLAGYKTPNREAFIETAENVAIESMNQELIEKVLKCFDKTEVERFVNFYYHLAQKSDDIKYYQKVLELDAGHFQSNMAMILRHFNTVEAKLSYQNREEIEGMFQYIDENARAQFITSIVDFASGFL